MSNLYSKYRFLVLRRVVQLGLLFLYIGGNYYGWTILRGNLSGSIIFELIPMSDPFAVLQMLTAGASLTLDVMIGALVVFILYGVFLGRAFCSWICPMNMVTDLANWLRRKLSLDKDETNIRLSRKIRYWVIGLSLVLTGYFGLAAFEIISPVSMLHRGVVFGIGMGWAAVLVIFLVDLFVTRNAFCGHICPLGGFYSAISRFSLFRVAHNHEKCTECMECRVVCPENQVLDMIGKKSVSVTNGECSNCGRCIEVCSDDALGFNIRNFTKK